MDQGIAQIGRSLGDVCDGQKNEINTAHIMRLVAVIVTGISASYGFALFGHMIGFGGLETMFTEQNVIIFLLIGFAGISFSLYSQHLDNLIYKQIQEYDDLQDENFRDVKKKIRSEDRIRRMLKRTTEEKTERAEKERKRLDKVSKGN